MFAIYMNGVYLESMQTPEAAEARIRTYERQDRYEVEVEGYAVPPRGYPKYEVKEENPC